MRPLIQQEGKGPSELSRKEEIFVAKSGLISIAGGKLTGYRKMAQRIMDLVADKLPKRYPECRTKHFKIHNNPFNEYKDYTAAIAQMEKKYSQDKLLQKHIRYLLTTYGNDAQIIIDQYNNKLSQNKQSSSKELLVEAQLEYLSLIHI